MPHPTRTLIVASVSIAALSVAALVAVAPPARAADETVGSGSAPAIVTNVLFNHKNLEGWKTRKEDAKASWKVVGEVKADNKTLTGSGEPSGDTAAMVLEKSLSGGDILTEQEFGDGEYHVEFMVPKGSNSGVYLMGQYEIQLLDSFGKKDADLKPGDVGGIYNTKAPSKNAAKAPGEWQSFDIVFRAPRFGPDGKKTENAKFISVKLNGETIHENIEAAGPTGGQLPGGEKPKGPLMFQGDHGPVAFRNVWVKPQ